MSKSLGDGIDPMDVVEKYSVDALHWFLSNGSTPGQGVRFSYEKMGASRNFINKIWNANRFIIMNVEGMTAADIGFSGEKVATDRWILTRLNETVARVTELFDRFEFSEAGRQPYNSIWDDFCDWYIEMSKEIPCGDNEAIKQTTRSILACVLDQILRLLHPIMPFVTGEIWERIPHQDESLAVAEYPVVRGEFNDEAAAWGMEILKEAAHSVRNIRAGVNTSLSKPVTLLIKTNDIEVEELLIASTSCLERFCNPKELAISREIEAPELVMSAVLIGVELFLSLAGSINIEEEITRLEKELDKWTREVRYVQGKFSDKRFAPNAPDEVMEAGRAKEKGYLEKQEAVRERIAQLRSI